MAILKKYNPETGQYEEVENASFGGESILSLKDSVGIASAYTIYPMSEYASAVSTSGTATTYTLNNLLKGDTITFKRSYNGQAQSQLIKNPNGEVTETATWKEYLYGTLVLENDYETLTVQTYDTDFAKVYQRIESMVKRPSFYGEFVPTINDDESNEVKTLSSQKIYSVYGMSEAIAKEKLSGGVWIALGDSYTVQAGTYFQTIAEKYGLIYDGQGKVSSTICGDSGGNKGFSPFWGRMNSFIANYTGDGQTIDDVVYKAEDVKLITFMGGANDGFGKESWLGSNTSMDTNYIYGACNYIFRKLKENFPNAKIICILQPANYSDAMNYTDDETAQALGFKDLAELQTWDIYSFGQYKMETKERAVKECAERFGIHIVDCIFDWYSVVNPTERATYWSTDKIHLAGEGSMALTNKLEQDGILAVFGK